MKQPPVAGWTAAQIEYPVRIPDTEGTGFSATVNITLEVWKNASGEIFLDDQAREQIEKTRARYMGLMSPEDIKAMREHFELTQKEMSELLQIGAKTWTRWESGKERPSRSMNLLLHSISDGRVDVAYLRQRQHPERRDKIIPFRPVTAMRQTFAVSTARPDLEEAMVKAG
jgi:DNA-binding transcriptional regulator YiaG